MGRCTLTFDQIEIINKKTGTGHLDNDWLIVNWLVNGQPVGDPEKFGMWILDSGQGVFGVQCQGVACNDNDIVTAVISMVNLDAMDYSDQVQTVGDLSRDIAQEAAKIYLEEVRLYLKYAGYVDLPDLPGPLADLAADLVDKLEGPIIDGIAKIFDDIIIPLLNDMIDEVRVLIGDANCNGDVLHDALVFKPSQFGAIAIDNTYEAAHIRGCGSSARTRVHMTMHREFVAEPSFTNTPPPQVDMVPAGADFDFNGTWADDPGSPVPRITVVITESNPSSRKRVTTRPGPILYDVTVQENVDPRFNAVFETAAKGITAKWGSLLPYLGEPSDKPPDQSQYGHVRPMSTHPVFPLRSGVLFRPAAAPQSPGAAKSARAAAKTKRSAKVSSSLHLSPAVLKPSQGNFMFKLNWQTVQPSGGPLPMTPLRFTGAAQAKQKGSSVSNLLEHLWMLELPGDVVLAAMAAQVGGRTFAGTLRYLRAQNLSFTGTDVLIYPQHVIR